MVKIFTLRADSSADLQEVWRVTSAILPASDTMKIFIGCDTCYEIVREGDNNKNGTNKVFETHLASSKNRGVHERPAL